MKQLTLMIVLSLGLTSISLAGYLDDWTDDQLCGWMDNPSPPEHIVVEINKRGLSCGGSNKSSASKDTPTAISNTDTSDIGGLSMDFELTSYDIELSESVTEELLSETLKTDFDFSNFKLAKNHRNLECQFYLEEVMHNQTGPWTSAEGFLVIDSGEVKIDVKASSWKRGGLSTDPIYLREEVNLRLTEDGYLVGKMAYFEWVGDGEPPKLPIYPRLLKHKKSIPLNYKNPTTGSAKFLLEKTLDWSDAILYLKNCIMYEESYKDGKLDGKRSVWYGSGEIKSEISYKDGKREGKTTWWYPSREIRLEANYKDGKKEGKFTTWYENGQIKSEDNYKNDKRKFQSTSWYQNGQIKSEQNYKDGKETTWYQSGKIKSEVHYLLSKKQGKDTTWYENGQKKAQNHYINGKKEGKSTVWYQSGQKNSEVNYKDNKIGGKQTKWYENGQIKSEENYKTGKTGFSVFHGEKEGKFTTWYENGQLKSEENYLDNKREGKRTSWHKNGQVMYKDNFKDGKLDGIKTKWNKDGLKESETNYKDGILIL
jgi:antitoxin component YwqK of YwqJK toxin-antitoxin module